MNTVTRSVVQNDAAEIALIYNHYVANSYISFETEAVPMREMEQRITETLDLSLPWLVTEASGKVIGYAYASKWKGRCAYRFSVESTIYMDPAHIGKGLGLRLYAELIGAIRNLSMHSAIGGIALPNEQSVGLHERLGFKKVAHFDQVGYKQDRWVDVGYWQLIL